MFPTKAREDRRQKVLMTTYFYYTYLRRKLLGENILKYSYQKCTTRQKTAHYRHISISIIG